MSIVLIHQSRSGTGSLWQGGAEDVVNPDSPHDVLVLCADEFQPEASLFLRPGHGKTLIYAPNDDSEKPLTRAQLDLAIPAAKQVSRAFREGKNVLVSCMQGRNRSGFVMALTLHLLYGMSGDSAARFIRSRRQNALMNPHFNAFLQKIPSRVPVPKSMLKFRGGHDGIDD